MGDELVKLARVIFVEGANARAYSNDFTPVQEEMVRVIELAIKGEPLPAFLSRDPVYMNVYELVSLIKAKEKSFE